MCAVQGLLLRDQDQRMTAAQALQHPWVCEAGCAPDVPLEGTVMQRLQRHATYGHMKQLVLHIIAQGVIGEQGSKELEIVTALRYVPGLSFEAFEQHPSGPYCSACNL